MATLTFKPFADNARIRLAADDRRSPIATGDPNREAVRILQNALLQAGIPLPDGADGIFGPFTAAAVRAAETKFGLRLDAGQAGPDVIAALDKQLSRRREPVFVFHSATLNLMLQQTPGLDQSKFNGYFAKAAELLDQFSLTVSMVNLTQPPIPFEGRFDDVFDVSLIRKASEKQTSGRRGVLRVILADFLKNGPQTNGVTESDDTDPKGVDFIVLNANSISGDKATLIHEMIHATGLVEHDPDPDSVFFKHSDPAHPRTILKPEHAERIRLSFFATSTG